MSKSILVIDTPKTCLDCKFCREVQEGIEACCELSEEQEDNTLCRMIDCDYYQEKPKWCPLKDTPQKLGENADYALYGMGWDDCIDEILKESD